MMQDQVTPCGRTNCYAQVEAILRASDFDNPLWRQHGKHHHVPTRWSMAQA
jgi:hypothetical protein